MSTDKLLQSEDQSLRLVQIERTRIKIFKDIVSNLTSEISELQERIQKIKEEEKHKNEVEAYLEQQKKYNQAAEASMAKTKANVNKMLAAKTQKDFNQSLLALMESMLL